MTPKGAYRANQQDGRLVREDVAEEVLRDDHIERCWPGGEEHRRGVNQAVLQLHVGILGANLGHHLAPESAGGKNVCLINGCESLAALARKFKGDHGDAADLIFVIRERVYRLSASRRHLFARRLPKVETASQLAHHHQVYTNESLRLEWGRVIKFREDGNGTEVGEKFVARAECEERLLRSNACVRVIPLRSTNGAKEECVRRIGNLQILFANRHAVRVNRTASSGDLKPLNGEAEAAPRRVKDASCRSDHIWTNTVARNANNTVVICAAPLLQRERGTLRCEAHCIASRDPFVGALAAPDSIAASLFAAVM